MSVLKTAPSDSRSEQMQTIGQLAAGIAHEINTPTQYVGDNLRFLQDALQSSMGLLASISRLRGYARETAECGTLLEEIHELAEEAERSDHDYLMEEAPRAIAQALDGVQRVAIIVRAMKDFSHPHHENKVPFDLNRAIETTLIVAHNELKYVADVVTDLDTTLPLVPCLPGEINQVILNLLINAAHAIGDANRGASGKRGTITVSTRRIDDVAEMRITDTGTGIPEGARDRIFEPFFTTKDVGRGTGQGLAIAHTVVVKKHGGQIRFETQTGQGTTFIVLLPLPQADVAAA